MNKMLLSLLLIGTALPLGAATSTAQWSGTGPLASGLGERVITTLALSADGALAYAGTGSGTVLQYAYPQTAYSAASATGSGTVSVGMGGGSANCGLASAQFTALQPPEGIVMPHGAFSFSTTDCGAGATLTFTINYPQPLPAGTRYYKYGPEFGGSQTPHWYVLPGAVVSGQQITFSITDNGAGDSDPAVGFITDPGGPGLPAGADGVSGVPALSPWALCLLAGLMLALAWGAGRRTRRQAGAQATGRSQTRLSPAPPGRPGEPGRGPRSWRRTWPGRPV